MIVSLNQKKKNLSKSLKLPVDQFLLKEHLLPAHNLHFKAQNLHLTPLWLLDQLLVESKFFRRILKKEIMKMTMIMMTIINHPQILV